MNSQKKILISGTLSILVAAAPGFILAEHPETTGASTDQSALMHLLETQVMHLTEQLQSMKTSSVGVVVNSSSLGGDMACAFTRDLTGGDVGDDVTCLQKVLHARGLLSSEPTGYFGGLTRAAVAAWQAQNGITPMVGYFGARSRDAFQKTTMVSDEHQDEMSHAVIDVSSWSAAPTVDVQVHKDAKDGWNVRVITTNFRFAPEHVNGTNVVGEGHAHLYIGGRKVGRLYGEWLHVPASAVKIVGPGTYAVRVTLNANDHSEYALGSNVISDTEMVVAR